MDVQHRVWAEIDLGAVRHNYRLLRSRLKPATKVMAVLKADAYGHGAVKMAQLLESEGAEAIGVGDSQEALELRRAGVGLPILVLGCIVQGEMEAVIANDIQANIHSPAMAAEMNELAGRMGRKARVQLEVDTGMGRLGIDPYQCVELLRRLPRLAHLQLTGINTHFSSAGEANPAFVRRQLTRFRTVLDLAKQLGLTGLTVHSANHTALMRFPESHFDMVRPGLALYGLCGHEDPSAASQLRRVLTLKTQIAFLKDVPEGTPISYDRRWYATAPTRIATLPIGYNDGYRLALTGKAEVLVRGVRCPVVGRITMDYTMVDVGMVPDAAIGDPVTLVGKDGHAEITLEELAGKMGTIPYEVTCGLGKRVQRVYVVASAARTSKAA